MYHNPTERKNPEPEDVLILEKLDLLKEVPSRDPSNQLDQKKAFLARASRLKQSFPVTVPVSQNGRHKLWKDQLQKLKIRKEPRAMFFPFVSILVVFTLLFGGGAVAVSASQDSLPGQPLWALKTWAEEARVRFEREPEGAIEIQLQNVQRRMEELRKMVDLGVQPPGDMIRLMERQMDRPMEQAALMEDADLLLALETIQSRFQVHERDMTQLMENQPEDVEPVLNQIRQTIQERLRLIDGCLEDPEQLRLWVRTREQLQINEPPEDGQGDQNSFGPTWTEEPGNEDAPWGQDDDQDTGPETEPNQYQNQGELNQNQDGAEDSPQQLGKPSATPQNQYSQPDDKPGSDDQSKPASTSEPKSPNPEPTPEPNRNQDGEGTGKEPSSGQGNNKP